ncbi:hypothetical protein Tco_0837211 [Tanacetum coccineum]
MRQSLAYSQSKATSSMEEAQIVVGFCTKSLSKKAQAVTSRNDSLAILELNNTLIPLQMNCGKLKEVGCNGRPNGLTHRSFEDKILTPIPSPRCARCGTPVDGPSCRGCAFLRKKFDEDLLTYYVENGIFQDFQNTSESSDDNNNVVNALREPCVVNQDPGVKSSQDPPQIDQNYCYDCGDSLDGIFCRQCICKSCGKGAHFGYNCPPKDQIISKPEPCNQTINEIPQTLPSLDPSYFSLPHVSKPNLVDDPPNVFNLSSQIFPIVHPLCNYENKNSFIYDSKPHSFNVSSSVFNQPQQPQFETCISRREIDEDIERCEIRIRKLKQDFNEWGSKVRKKEKAYEDEKYAAAFRYMLFVTCDDEDDYIPLAITTDLPIEEPDNSLNMGDEHLNTIPATESDEVIKSSVENLVPIPSEFEGISDDTSDVPNCDNNCVNIKSELVETLVNRDTSIVHSSKIDPIFEEFAGELASYQLHSPWNSLKREGENIVVSNVEKDDSFTFTIRTFLPFLTYPEVSPLSCSTGSEDLIFDLGIITFHFLKPLAFLWKFLSSIFALPKDE